jgi:hypothetical protein
MHPEQLELSGIFYFVHISITNNKGNFIMNLKIFVYKTGKPISEIKQIVEKAIKEAQILGLENDDLFIESITASLLDMNDAEYLECIRELNKIFLESKYDSFNDFMESLVSEEMVSTGFAVSDRPENFIKPEPKKDKDDEEDK